MLLCGCSKAINGGSSDPPSHQPGSKGREGRMGGSQGKHCTIHALSPYMVTSSQAEKLLNVKVDTIFCGFSFCEVQKFICITLFVQK